jgi:hypothetical protein
MDRWGWEQIERRLQGIDNNEIINTIYARPAPTLPASAGLR